MDQSDRERELLSLEQALRQPDSVLEPMVLTIVGRYLHLGGHAHNVIELLSENYSGYGRMASLVCKWLNCYAPSQELQMDEVSLLQQLVKERFDPKRMDAIFVRGPPAWLDRLIQNSSGRELIYDLSARHHNCLLLNYAIQKIFQMGHEAEVAARGSSLASYFGIFQRLLMARLKTALGATAEQLAIVSQELRDSCAHSLHTYVHVQMVLSMLSREDGGAVYRRLSEDLEEAVAKEHPVAWRLQHILLPGGSTGPELDVVLLLESLLLVEPPLPATSRPALLRLHAACQAQPSGADGPPASPGALLRHPHLLRLLLETLFSPSMPQPAEVQDACTGLLAMATTTPLNCDVPGGEPMELEGASGADGEENMERAEAARRRLSGREAGPRALQDAADDAASTAAALQVAVQLCGSAAAGITPSSEDLEVMQQALDVPVSALGVLHYARILFTNSETYMDPGAASQLAAFRHLLTRIASLHVELGLQVLELARDILEVLGPINTEISRVVLDMLAQQLLLGHHVEPILQCVEAWAAQGDSAAVRSFVFMVLGLCAPPYSPEFAAALLRLMASAAIRRSRDCPAGTQLGQLLDDFLQSAAGIVLPHIERTLLQDMASR